MFRNCQISKKLPHLIAIFGVSAILACVFEMGIIESSQFEKPVPTVITPAQKPVSNPDSENEEVEYPLPADPETDCQETTLAGLIFAYRDEDESLWQVGTCGNLFQLSAHSNVRLLPGGDQALYIKNDDIWLVDLLDESERNLTNTPDRIEVNPRWWQGQEDLIVFGSWSATEDLGPTSGYLSLISRDGSNYRVLVDQPSNADPAPQPNGTLIAYDLGDTAWLYHLEKDESEFFDLNLYGLNFQKGQKIGNPSWSPDGSKLAWWLGGVFSPPINGTVALVVFDLDDESAELLHPYSPIGTGGWLLPPSWSPNGEWLAAVTISEAHKTDLWVIRVDSGEEHLLGFASNPVWHPDSSTLVYQAWKDNGIKMIEMGDWKLQTIDLPPGSTPLGWQGIIRDLSVVNQQSSDIGPSFGPEIHFTTDPEKADSQTVFPYGTLEIFAILQYHNMLEGLTVRAEWYLDGGIFMVEEELWDIDRHGIEGFLTNFSVYDFEQGLEPGRYQLRLYIDSTEQALGHSEAFSSAIIEIAAPLDISPQISPDYSQAAIVEPPGTLIIQDIETQEQRPLLSVDEISSLAWYPDGKFILFSVRDRSGQQSSYEPLGFIDELWVVHLETGESYPFQDQNGQTTGTNLHHAYVSPDGHYLAAIEGSGWTDACLVASKLWVKAIELSGSRLYEVYSYYQLDFAIDPQPERGEMYVERIIGWDSPTFLNIELGWACTGEELGGIYRLDMSTLTAVQMEGSE